MGIAVGTSHSPGSKNGKFSWVFIAVILCCSFQEIFLDQVEIIGENRLFARMKI